MKTSTPTPTPRPALKATGMRRRHARCLETELATLTTERDHWQKIAVSASHEREHNANVAQAMTAERDQLRAELAAERAIVSRIWTQLGSPTYAQLKGRSIYDLIDELKAELAKERARLDWVFHNCKVEANDYTTGNRDVYYVHDREDLGAAMKEDAK